ncbi:MAG: DUF4433 domain-containing protein [Acidobacteria bacterium]|nr:DUF4433 domain-containing protein [Acidobacteriota bacterium]
MADLNKVFLYRMTHIENIPHILKYGITHASSPYKNPAFVSIGDPSLISTRNSYQLKNGNLLGEYIPFYFGCRMPMLYVIQRGYNSIPALRAENIAYCVTSVEEVIKQDIEFIFTDGHAVNAFSREYSKNEVNNILDLIDYNAVNQKYWNQEGDLDLKRRKEAEFLILSDLEPDGILGYIVYNEAAKQRLIAYGIQNSPVYVRPDRYF